MTKTLNIKKARTPLKGLKNFGPITYAEFESMNFLYLDQIQNLGFEETCRQWVQYYPERLNANAFLGIACAIDGVTWTKASEEHRQMAHTLATRMRKEYGQKPVKKSSNKVRKATK